MSEILSLEEIKKRYPNQWVLIELSEPNPDPDDVSGKVIATSPDRLELYRKLVKAKVKSFAIEYTGEPPEDLAYIL